jgi:L,D-transpeptidase catalytic domain
MTQTTPAVPRSPGLRRGIVALAVTVPAALIGCVLAAPAQGATARVPASQPLVVLLQDHVALARPNAKARRVDSVRSLRPLTRVRTVLPVLGRSRTRSGYRWVHVRLPGRPNSHTGWIRAAHTRRASTGWRLSLDLSSRQVTVYDYGRVKHRFRAVIGTPSTPTPRGRFFIEEALALSAPHGGPYALATSARSTVLQEFEGGPGQIALHGTHGLAGALGTAASHGCIRLSTGAITWLAKRIRGGVPLTIRR